MKYYTDTEIQAMKSNGYDPVIVQQAEEQKDKVDDVITIISNAFEGVVLEEGIGLYEAQAIDDYMSKSEQERLRSTDEKLNWQALAYKDLNKCNSSLSFFDAKGMRFHLPAYLIADLEGQYNFGMEFSLTHLSDYSKTQFSLFSQEQRASVRYVLNYMFNEPDCEYFSIDIANALLGFWSEGND